MGRLAVSLGLSSVLLAGCSSSGNQSNQQVRDLQATVAALQKQLAQSTTSTTPLTVASSTVAGQSATATASAPRGQSTPTPASTTPQPFAPAVDGDVTVLANGYGLPGTTGYDTAVAFRVKNPSSQAGILRMPCRVTVSSGPDVIFASDGRDAVTLRPGESHVVVYETTAIKGTKPTAASVQFYPAPSMYVDGKGLSDTTKWDVANSRVTCDKSFIQCNVTADLTWKGDAPQRNVSISVVTHQAGDNSGPIVGAGNGQPDYSFQQITTGQTVPVQVSTFGYVQNGPTGGLTLPSGPLTLEIYVASEPVTP